MAEGDNETPTSAVTAELLAPVAQQIVLDKTRFKLLVNGDVDDTVDLEVIDPNNPTDDSGDNSNDPTRTVKSIAGQIKDRIDSLSYDFEQAKNTIEQTEVVLLNAKDTTIAARDAAQTSETNAQGYASQAEADKNQARTYRNEANNLKIETRDYRDEILTEPYYFPYYLTKSEVVPTSGEIDVANAAVNRLDGTTNITLSFTNGGVALGSAPLPSDRAQNVIVFVTGAGGNITWPSEVQWSGGNVPELGTNWTSVILFWTGTIFIGITSAKQ